MKVFENREEETPIIGIRKKNNQHVDIFNTKEAGYLVIKNDEPVIQENVFQKNVDEAFEKYEGNYKRPSSSYNKSNVTYREGSYTFNQDWSSPNQFSSKTLVNEGAAFEQDYHHKRRFLQNSSSIFPVETKQTNRMYKKNIEPTIQKTNFPNSSQVFGRRNILKQQLDKLNHEDKKYSHNYSNLFGLGQRIQKIQVKQTVPQTSTLIPSGISWQQYDSVLQNGCKDQQINGDYHRKRNLENMKSSLDTHTAYEVQSTRQVEAPIQQIVDIVNKYGHMIGKKETSNNQNDQRASNQPGIVYHEPPKTAQISRKTRQRPSSAMKPSQAGKQQKQIQIVITKGLTSKFNLNNLCQQCRLHSLVLSHFNNTVAGEKGTGRGTIKVIPQKKFGFDVLCSWLRSQGLSILIRGS